MRETWLKNNARAAWLAAALPAVGVLAGGLFLAAGLRALGGVLAGVSALLLAFVISQARRPRLAVDAGHLLVNLRPGGPIRVPLNVVEGFLLGQGPSFLPGKRFANTEAATLIVRLAERAPEWGMIETDRRLGSWCGHYITIHGAWCQPLSIELANRLNARLAETKQNLRAAAEVR